MKFEDRLRRELHLESESLPVVGVDLGGTLKRGRQVRRRSMLMATGATALVIAAGIAGTAYLTRSNGPDALQPGGNPTSPATESEEPPTNPSPSPSSPPADDGTLDNNDVLRVDGLGPLRIGMTVEEVEAATGLEARIGADFTPACRYMELIGGPPDVFYMVSHRVLVRIDIGGPKILTDTGLGVGDDESAVADVYGPDLTTEPHPYLGERGSYLIADVDPNDGLLMIFETDRGKVTQFRSGYDEQARYIEGCA
jgi:hypothetical protein